MCDNVTHPLKEIYRTGYDENDQHVIRWCPDCGAIVVDAEYDGRIFPGKILPMLFPTRRTP